MKKTLTPTQLALIEARQNFKQARALITTLNAKVRSEKAEAKAAAAKAVEQKRLDAIAKVEAKLAKLKARMA